MIYSKFAVVKTSQLSFRTSHHPQKLPQADAPGHWRPGAASSVASPSARLLWQESCRVWSPVSGSPDQRAFRSTLWGSGIVPGVAGPRLFFSRQPTNVWTDPLSECRWTLTRGSPEGRCLSGLHSHVYLGRPVCDC